MATVIVEGDDRCRRLHGRHHPRKRMIQYAAAPRLYLVSLDYWMAAFAGMTAFTVPDYFPLARMKSKSQPSSA
jgi:hypothetical protein